MLVMLIGLLSSCSLGNKDSNDLSSKSKSELIDLVNNYSDQIASDTEQMDQLKALLGQLQGGSGDSTSAISTMSDGSGKTTFNSFAGKIIFPNAFEYPNSTQAPAASTINITKDISIAPTSNWICTLDGASLTVNHSSNGIVGTIKAGIIQDTYDRTLLKSDIFSQFFSGIPASNISYTQLFLDDDWWGLQATATTNINSKEAQIRCGMVGYGDSSLIYTFVYDGKQDATKDELEQTLLKTISMYNKALRLN